MNCYSNSKPGSHLVRMSAVDVLKKVSLALFLVLSAANGNPALAQDGAPLGVQWRCVQQYDEVFNILCIPAPAGDGSFVPASLRGGDGMPPAPERGVAEEFLTRAQSVPLYARPSDKDMVGILLQSVLCDTAPRCTVSYRIN
jgi:hypothetical protein